VLGDFFHHSAHARASPFLPISSAWLWRSNSCVFGRSGWGNHDRQCCPCGYWFCSGHDYLESGGPFRLPMSGGRLGRSTCWLAGHLHPVLDLAQLSGRFRLRAAGVFWFSRGQVQCIALRLAP